MYLRFVLYSVLKNLRFFEPFFVLYLLAPPASGGAGLSYFQIGTLVGYQKLLTGLLEIPLGVATDRWGRRTALALCFSFYLLAFPTYAIASQMDASLRLVFLFVAQGFFAVAEALRTGSHKAIMLDWADQTGRPGEATRVVSRTRLWSKLSAGFGALAGGIMLWRLASFTPLFWAASVPAAAGVVLMLSYPRRFEGEQRRSTELRPPFRRQMGLLFRRPGLLTLILASLIFESQVKLAQQYLQPFLRMDLDRRELALVGGLGAVAVGAYYLLQDLLGASAAAGAPRAESRLGGAVRALARLQGLLLGLSAAMALCFGLGWLSVGIVGFIAMAMLQNLRRPIFVARLNELMDKPQRATTLSVESQARSWTVALFSPLVGYVADRFGLTGAFSLIAGLLLLSIPLWMRGQSSRATSASE
jgi:MFS family permease